MPTPGTSVLLLSLSLSLSLVLACTGADPAPPVDTTPECGEGELYDGEACVPEACGMAPWGDVDGTVFVDASAEDGGDGSRDAPFQALAEAVAVASGEDVVAVADGTYVEHFDLADRDLTLAGRCAERVTIDGLGSWSADEGHLPIIAFNQDSEGTGTGTLRLSGLTLVQQEGAGVVVEGGRLEAHELVVRGFSEAGVRVAWAEATLTDVTMEEAHSDGGVAAGLEIVSATVHATGLRVEGTIGGAVDVWQEDAALVLEDSELVGIEMDEFYRATGVYVHAGHAVVRRVRVSDVVNAGLAATEGATVEFEDVEVDGVRPPMETPGTCCPAVYAGFVRGWVGEESVPATITGQGLTVRDSASAVGATEGGAVYLADVDARDLGEGLGGGGIMAGTGGSIEIDGLYVERAKGVAIFANVGGHVSVRDAEVIDVQRGSLQPVDGADLVALYGLGAMVDGGEMRLQDVAFRGVSGEGIGVTDRVEEGVRTSSQVWLQDVTVEDISPSPSGRSAAGLLVLGGTVEAAGLVVRNASGPGLVVSPWEDAQAEVSCTGCRFEDVEMAGAALTGGPETATLTLEDCVVQGVAPDDAARLSVGLMATGADGPTSLLAEGCEIDDIGIAAVVAQGDVAVTVRDSTLAGGSGLALGGGLEVHGNVVYATGTTPWDGSAGLRLEGNSLVPGLRETVLLHDASMTLSDNDWEGGTLRQQHCADSVAVDGLDEAPEAVVCPETDVLVLDLSDSPFQFPPIVVD